MDPMTRKKLENIRHLMEAAGTVGEAEAAATAMQRMILKHNLTAEDLEGLGKQEREGYEGLFIRVAPDRKPGIQWRLNLLYLLSEYSFCAFIRYGIHGATGMIVGQPSNQEAVRVMFQATVETVERLAEGEWYAFRSRERDWRNAGEPASMAWKNSFKIGFSVGLRQKLQMDRKAIAIEDVKVNALVLVKGAELETAVQQAVGKTTTHKGSAASNVNGYQRGVEKGLAHELQKRLDA